MDANTGCSSPQWCLAISVVEITITVLKDIREPKANATVSADEENGKLKRGFLDVTVNVDFVGRGRSPLGYNGAFGFVLALKSSGSYCLPGRKPQ